MGRKFIDLCARYAGPVDKAKWAERPRLTLFSTFPTYMASGKSKVLAKRFLALCCVGALLSLVAPVIADENSSPTDEATPLPSASSEPFPETAPTDAPSEVPIPLDSTQPTPTPSPTPSAPSLPGASPSPSDTTTALAQPSPSPSPTPVAPLKNQGMRISVPSVLPVDPRATSRNLPGVIIIGPRYLLACLQGSNLYFDIYLKGSAQAIFNNQQLVSGDLTSQLLISGTTDQVLAIINSYGGLKATSTRGAIGNLNSRLSFVAMNEPTLEVSFCDQGSNENLRFIQFRPLGIEKKIIKNSLTLKN